MMRISDSRDAIRWEARGGARVAIVVPTTHSETVPGGLNSWIKDTDEKNESQHAQR